MNFIKVIRAAFEGFIETICMLSLQRINEVPFAPRLSDFEAGAPLLQHQPGLL